MNSAEAREYVRLATTETKGKTKTACDLLIGDSIKLEKIEQIINGSDDFIKRNADYKIAEIREVLEDE